jgi:hypothetical protein
VPKIDPARRQLAAELMLGRPASTPLHGEPLQKRIAELKSRIPAGGLREAVIRALLICGASKGRRIPATNCETLARFLPQIAKPESLRRSTPETGVR